MRHATLLTFALTALCVQSLGAEPAFGPAEPSQPIDLVICLDTSSSMNGLIDSAKQKLWAIVNDLATAKPKPALRVALYQYGNTGLDAKTGWVRQECALTGDLDKVYEELFILRTDGGTEYVARVVRAATQELDWSAEKNALKLIFVAGNEQATQDGEYPLQDICKAAVTKGIIVNTIFCGRTDEGQRTGWKDAADWADGRYAAIDQDRGTVVIATPHDKKLAELSAELNKTYIPFGPAGDKGRANQFAQDANASSLAPAAAAERAVAKSSGLYSNTGWDLVDASRQKDFRWDSLKPEDLPKEMQAQSDEQRQAYVAEQAGKRAEISKQIQQLNSQREAYIKEELAKQSATSQPSFDAALRETVRAQAEAKNFHFEKP